jgi:hypothetical protein
MIQFEKMYHFSKNRPTTSLILVYLVIAGGILACSGRNTAPHSGDKCTDPNMVPYSMPPNNLGMGCMYPMHAANMMMPQVQAINASGQISGDSGSGMHACRISDSDGIIITERIIRLIANMYIAYLNPLWALLAAFGTVIAYGIHFAYESYTQGRPQEIYDLPWCILSAWSLVMDWMVIAAYMIIQTTSHIGSEFLGIIVGCVLVSMGVHSTSTAFPGASNTMRNIVLILWLFIYFPWIYWPYVSLFEPYGYGPYRPMLPHQRLMLYFMNFFYNFWYSIGMGMSGFGSYYAPQYATGDIQPYGSSYMYGSNPSIIGHGSTYYGHTSPYPQYGHLHSPNSYYGSTSASILPPGSGVGTPLSSYSCIHAPQASTMVQTPLPPPLC